MNGSQFRLFWIFVSAITLPAAVVLSTQLARRSFEKVKIRDQAITVKGYAEKRITADLANWSASVNVRNLDLATAYSQLETGRARVLKFLADNGFPAADVGLSPVSIRKLYTRTDKGIETNQLEGYVLRQTLSIESRDVQRAARVAREVSDLIKEGIELESEAPSYIYTKLDEVKIEMIGEATGNARLRAEQLVSHSPSHLGGLRSASQGVFQITPAHSNEASGSGENDTSSMHKAIKAVVTVEYAIE